MFLSIRLEQGIFVINFIIAHVNKHVNSINTTGNSRTREQQKVHNIRKMLKHDDF